MDAKQIEMDLVERKVLASLFGKDFQNNVYFKFVAPKAQNYINKFEAIARPIMNEDGTINAERAKKLLEVRYPKALAYLPQKDFRLSDIVDALLGEKL